MILPERETHSRTHALPHLLPFGPRGPRLATIPVRRISTVGHNDTREGTMALRDWIRKRMAEAAEEGGSSPVSSLVYSALGKDEEAVHALGEYTSATYPSALADAVRRRNEVAAELRGMDIGTESGRRESAPRIVELL